MSTHYQDIGLALRPAGLMPVIRPITLADWRNFLREGDQFLNTALRAVQKQRAAFTPEILYNLAAMAIEKHFMALLMFHGDMADNHTMADLISSVERHLVFDQGFKERLLFLDAFQDICDQDSYRHSPPDPAEILAILATAEEVRDFVAGRTAAPAPA